MAGADSNRPRRTNDTKRHGKQLPKSDKAQNTALRAILLVWRTTPTVVLQREAATPPIYHTLDYLCELAALRLHKLGVQHPLRIRTKQAHTAADPSCLERLRKKLLKRGRVSRPITRARAMGKKSVWFRQLSSSHRLYRQQRRSCHKV